MKPSEYSQVFGLGPATSAQVSLHEVLFGNRAILGEHARRSLRIETRDEAALDTARGLVIDIRTKILAQHLDRQAVQVYADREVEFETWATWWDHFKADQREATSPLWRWVARSWPPKTRTVTKKVTLSRTVQFDFEALFPDAAARFQDVVFAPGLGQPYRHWRHEQQRDNRVEVVDL